MCLELQGCVHNVYWLMCALSGCPDGDVLEEINRSTVQNVLYDRLPIFLIGY